MIKKVSAGTCDSPTTISAQWDFKYDGDGNRVKQTYTSWDGQGNPSIAITAYFMGGAYESTLDVNGTQLSAEKYYAIAGMTIAVSDGTALSYLLTDHLGSVVAITNAQGALVQQQRYMPFGQVRELSSYATIALTDYGYTGQRNFDAQGNAGLGLMDYHARFYDAALGRFIQPDTIIPNRISPQTWNRYSYVSNDPIVLNDPTGHLSCVGKNSEDGPQCFTSKYLWAWNIKTKGASEEDNARIIRAASLAGEKISSLTGGDAQSAFKKSFGGISINIGEGYGPKNGNCETVGGNMSCHDASKLTITNILHELGHAFDNRYQAITGKFASDSVPAKWNGISSGYICNTSPCMEHSTVDFPPSPENPHGLNEEFADMFLNWTFSDRTANQGPNGFTSDSMGFQRWLFMQGGMMNWLHDLGLR